MWHARFSLLTLMILVVVAAIDCAFLPVAERLAGGLLIGLALQIGPLWIVRASGRARRFWVGFEATGLTLVVAYVAALHSASNRAIVQWPFSLFAGLMRACSHLPEDLQLWLLRHVLLDPNQALRVIDVIAVFEISYGLPMVLLAVAGGLLATLAGPALAPAGPSADSRNLPASHRKEHKFNMLMKLQCIVLGRWSWIEGLNASRT